MAKIGSLVIDLKAEIASFRTSMEKANGLLNSNVGKMRTSLNRLEKSFATVGKAVGLLQGAFLALAGVGAVGQIIKMADDYKTLQARIESVTKATGDYANVSKQLNAIAGATGSKLETTVDVFQRIQIGAKDLGKSNTEILKVVKAVQQLGALGGASTEAMNAGLLQFGQALSSGRVYAEEFNSIVENLPLVAQKIAEGFGVSVGQLKMMVKEGKVTSEQVFAVLLAKSKEVEKSFSALPPSVARSMNDLGLTFVSIVGDIDKSTNATTKLAEAIQGIVAYLRAHKGEIVGTFTAVSDAIQKIINKINEWQKKPVPLLAPTPIQAIGKAVKGVQYNQKNPVPLLAPTPLDLLNRGLKYFTGGAKALAPNLPQINSQSYGKIIQMSDYQTRLGGALGGLNTPEQITAMGETFNQTAATMQSRVQGIEQAVQQYGRTFEGVFMDAVMNGKFNFKEFARSVLADIAQMAFRMTVIAPLFGGTTITGKSTKGLFGNILGSIAGSLFGGGKLPGRAAGGPVSAFKPYLVGEKGPELFMPGKAGTIVPNDAMGGGQVIQVHNHVHLTAGVPEQVRATVISMMPQIQKAAVDGTVKAISRGGDITRAVGQKK